jgi:hypothetical protein
MFDGGGVILVSWQEALPASAATRVILGLLLGAILLQGS